MKKNKSFRESVYPSLRKILLIIRNATILLILGVLQAYAVDTYSQKTRLSLDYSDTEMNKVLDNIEIESEFYFLYNEKLLDTERKVSITAKDQLINVILNNLFAGTDVNYSIIDRKIILAPEYLTKETDEVSTFQQQVITGTLTDSRTGEAMPGVNISVKGTTLGTITDNQGNFTLSVPERNATLVFSFIGYLNQEIPLNGRTTINVALEGEVTGLDEVVVIGYGTQKKVNLTGAVGMATGERLENRPIASVGEGLQGVIPNLNISKPTGDPTEASNYNIRGFTSINGGNPLILVDGVPMSLDRVNPNDIKSVSVLKDAASAAIYGARAAFGVILVETKQGTGNIRVTFSAEPSLSKPIFLMDMETDPYKFAVARNEANIRTRGTPLHSQTYLDGAQKWVEDPTYENTWAVVNGVLQFYGNSDVWDKAITDFAPQQKYDLSVSGASENASYYLSFGFLDKDGYLKRKEKNLQYKRYNILMKVNFKITKWLSIDEKITFNAMMSDEPHDYGGEANLNTLARVGPNFMLQFPDLPYYIEPGDRDKYEQYIGMYMSGYNFLGYLDGGRETSNINDTWLTQGITLTPPVRGLEIKGDFSYNTNFRYYQDVASKVNLVKSDLLQVPLTDNFASGNDYINNQTNYNQYYVLNTYAEYTMDRFDNHYLKAMVGFNQEWGRNENMEAQANTLITPEITELDATTGTQRVYGGETQVAMRGVFSRLNYRYKEKYMLEINARYDGTSRFPKMSRFGFFPSISAAWRISNEPFMDRMNGWLDNLKLRASYGELGNQQVGFYPYISTMAAGVAGYILSTGSIPYISAPGLVSPTLTWETVATQNLGLDFAILDQRLDVTFDVYIRDTKDMLMNVTYPALLGTSAPQQNAADLRTKGWELSITWRNRIGNDWNYNLNLALADNQSVITKYENPTGVINDYYVGKKVGEIWGFETVGIFQYDEDVAAAPDQAQIGANWRAGDIQYADLNDDKKITRGSQTLDDPGDLKIIGNSTARYSYGIKPDISYKNWTLDLFFQGLLKRDFMPPSSSHVDFFPFATDGVEKYYITETWTEENRNAYFPAKHAAKYDKKNIQAQSRYLQNAAYIRFKNLTLNYNLPQDLVSKMRMESAQIYFSGQNLWEYTKMHKPLDPEVITLTQQYYKQRIYALGVKVTF